jgi:PAS domain S-box-containing protein
MSMKPRAKSTDALLPLGGLADERVLNLSDGPLADGLLADGLLDLLPVGVWVCDRLGVVVRVNRVAAGLWGNSSEPGEPFALFDGALPLFRPDMTPLPPAESPMTQVLATGRGVRGVDAVVEKADGSRVALSIDVDPIKDATGCMTGAIGVVRERPAPQPDPSGERAILEALPTAVYTTDADGRITFFNQAAVELWGVRPELGSSAFCGSWKLSWPDGTPLPHDECPMAIALRERRPVHGMQAVAIRPDGSSVPFLAMPTPLFDAAGNMVGAVNMLVDISGRLQADRAAQQLAAIVESSDDAILTKDLNGLVTSWNAGAQRLFGYTAEEVLGKPVTILIPHDRQGEEPRILAQIRRGERVEHYETVRRRKDGRLIEISLSVSPVRNGNGRITGASKIARDITERKRAEERQRLLMREMEHRLKNMFALSGSVISLSARTASTPRELAAAVQQRLQALARAHALSLPRTIEDAEHLQKATSLRDLVESIVAPFDLRTGGGASVIEIAGCDMPITGGSVSSFALLLHEFATNAAKHGALSVPGGRVAIDCDVIDDRLVLVWRERGGPRIEGPPEHNGFGALLSRTIVRGHLHGEITHDWSEEGLTIRLAVPRERIG